MYLSPVDMRFTYKKAFQTPPPETCETLLLDVILRDAMLFMDADQAEAAWSQMCPSIFRRVRRRAYQIDCGLKWLFPVSRQK
jgi:glucose-6-phosphate 1-dehydrogenase